MKTCSACGKGLPDYAVFCDVCGGEAVAAEEAVPAVAVETVSEVAPVAVEAEVVSAPAEKKSKKMWILLIALASVCLIVLVGWLTNWFGLVSPLAKIGKAAKKTAEANSFTIKIKVEQRDGGYTERSNTTIQCQVDQKKETLIYLSEGQYSTTLYMDGKEYYYSDYYEEYAGIHETGMDDGDIFDAYHDVYDGKKINWEELLEKTYLDDYVDADEMDAFIKTVYKEYLNNRTWLKETLGYSKVGKTYTFEPDLEMVCESVIDACDDAGAFDREAKENIEDTMEYFIDSVDDMNVKARVSTTLNKGYLSNIHVEFSADNMGDVEYDITITDINKTEIDTDRVIKRVKRIMENNPCDRCGEAGGEYIDYYDGDRLCYECYNTCESCGSMGEIEYWHNDGTRVCWDCQYRCVRCGVSFGPGDSDSSDGWLCNECYYTCAKCGGLATTTEAEVRYCYDCERNLYN